ncbi:hypothetical protein FISHEDRAFT_58795 [Fistulina hepatica ATCC 64428]|uniref:Uncharacterized protein n=1 Tax=Fistulina hepatica ATCC 64428 TaxID=1128425 RepID=A0A0D7ACA2_9AGAR|nr:hypothetical protein FISHEDRAFT_58795 [Fistulina hepatica ATCC 64428]
MVDDIDDDQCDCMYHPEDDEEADVNDLGDVSPRPQHHCKDKGKGKAKKIVDLLMWDMVEGLLANAMELMEQDSQLMWDTDDMLSDDEVLLQWEGCLARSRDAPFLVTDHPDFGIYKTNTYEDHPWHIDPHECHIPLVTSFEQVEEEGSLFFPVFAQPSIVGAQHPNYEQDWDSLTDSQKQFGFWLFIVKGLPIGWHSNDPSTADPVSTFRFFEPMKVVCTFLKLVMGHILEYCTVSVPILFCFGDRCVGCTITWTSSMHYNGFFNDHFVWIRCGQLHIHMLSANVSTTKWIVYGKSLLLQFSRREWLNRLGDLSSHMGMGAISLDRSLHSQPSPDDSPDASDAEEKGYVLAIREHIKEAILAAQEVSVLNCGVHLTSKQRNKSFGKATADCHYVRFSKSEKQVIKRLWNQIHKAASGMEHPMSQVLKHMGLGASVSYPIQMHNLYFKLLKAWKVEKWQDYEDLLHLDFNDFRTFAARHWKEEVQSQKMSEAELTAFTHQLQDELAENAILW